MSLTNVVMHFTVVDVVVAGDTGTVSDVQVQQTRDDGLRGPTPN